MIILKYQKRALYAILSAVFAWKMHKMPGTIIRDKNKEIFTSLFGGINNESSIRTLSWTWK